MLRYFYILICIQLCICYDYIEKPGVKIENNDFHRLIGSRSNRVHKKHTRGPKKRSKVVQFDVDNFMRKPDEDAVQDFEPDAYGNLRRDNRRVSGNNLDYSSLMGSNEMKKEISQISEFPEPHNAAEINTRSSPVKEINMRHFNFNNILAFDERNSGKAVMQSHNKVHHHENKATTNSHNKMAAPKGLENDPERKCAFRNMKIPFFSHKKPTEKKNRQKKRRMFCFNCNEKKLTSTTPEDNLEITTFDDEKGQPIVVQNQVSKRDYKDLCPKCLREFMHGLRSKSTKNAQSTTIKQFHRINKAVIKQTTTTVLEKSYNVDDSINDNFDYSHSARKKRSDLDDTQRDRQLKEIEEVEKKIESVHITAPTFAKYSFNYRLPPSS